MIKLVIPFAAAAVLGVAAIPAPARADFSACAAAYTAKDPQQQIDLYTSCLKHGGLMRTDVAGAFTNRGVLYYRLGEMDKAMADFSSAIEYDPAWPTAYVNRAYIEAGRGQCAQAQTDMKAALKLGPHRKEVVEGKAHIQSSCPLAPAPAN